MRPTRSPRPATLFPFTMLFLSHVEPFAPCYSRLLPRGPLPRTAGGSPQRRRRRLSLRLPMKTLIAPLLAAALLFGTVAHAQPVHPLDRIVAVEIGRASCRERVCPYE